MFKRRVPHDLSFVGAELHLLLRHVVADGAADVGELGDGQAPAIREPVGATQCIRAMCLQTQGIEPVHDTINVFVTDLLIRSFVSSGHQPDNRQEGGSCPRDI